MDEQKKKRILPASPGWLKSPDFSSQCADCKPAASQTAAQISHYCRQNCDEDQTKDIICVCGNTQLQPHSEEKWSCQSLPGWTYLLITRPFILGDYFLPRRMQIRQEERNRQWLSENKGKWIARCSARVVTRLKQFILVQKKIMWIEVKCSYGCVFLCYFSYRHALCYCVYICVCVRVCVRAAPLCRCVSLGRELLNVINLCKLLKVDSPKSTVKYFLTGQNNKCVFV